MTKQTLTEMGLTEDQAAEVMKSLDGEFVTKARFNEINGELKAAKASLTERDGQLEALRQSTGDVEALRGQIAQLQAENAQKDSDHAAQLAQIRMDNAVDRALSQAQAINPITVKPLLADFLAKAEVAEDGTVKGLDEELGKLAAAEGTSFLFRATEPSGQTMLAGAAPANTASAGAVTKSAQYAERLADARKAGDNLRAVSIINQAAADGVSLL